MSCIAQLSQSAFSRHANSGSANYYETTGTGSYQLFSSLTTTPTLSVNPATQGIAAGGGTFSFLTTSNGTWNWTVDVPWVTTSEATSQSGDQTFTYTVGANGAAAGRTAVITLTGGGLTATHTINQAGLVADDHGNSTATATVVASNSTTSGVIETPGDNDYFRIDVPASGTLLLQTTGATDTYGYLLNSLGTQLASDDDAGAGANFLISYAVTAGTYYLRLTHYSSTGTGAYQFVSAFSTSPASVRVLMQTLGDGSQSSWGDLFNASSDFMDEASLTTTNGSSGDAFDGVGILTVSPSIPLPPLSAPTSAGPLSTTSNSGAVRLTRLVSLVAGRHATDEEIILTNSSGTTQSVSLSIADDYGSDGSTTVHGTSSGDLAVTTGDRWFVTSDMTTASAISGDPALMVSWRWSGALPVPTFPSVPATGADAFVMNFGSFSLAAGQTATVTIRRELFDSASLALLNGLPLPAFAPEILLEQPTGTPLLSGISTVSFAQTLVATAGSPKVFTVRNIGTSPLAITGVNTTGGNNTDFSVNTTGMLSNVPGGGSTSFTVTFQPTFSGPRTTALRVLNDDPDESLTTLTVEGVGLTPLENWRLTYFGSAANSGAGADSNDYDFDGILNLAEFAFGMNPAQNSVTQMPQAQRIGANLRITFNQPSGVGGITYGAAWSTTMLAGDWHPVADTGTASLHVFSVPIGVATRLFMRLTVSSP